MIFTRAIVRPPAATFADGLTTAGLGAPDYEAALAQFEAYCDALRACGLDLIRLPADPQYPDAPFVEDTAVVTARGAILARPVAASRVGEIDSIRDALTGMFPNLAEIRPPGTLDGGDVCQAEGHFFIGLTKRTNEVGARQLAQWLAGLGYTSQLDDLRAARMLHLKTELAYLGDNRLVVTDATEEMQVRGFELVRVPVGEEYAANCVRINDQVLIAQGFPKLARLLRGLGYRTIDVELSEYRKMDGGLSCLSLRF